MTAGYSAAQIRAAEAPLMAAGEPLMRRAAAGLAASIRESVPAGCRVLLLVGSGDNGGDALFAGAELARGGYRVSILATGSRMHAAGLDAALTAGAVVADGDPAGLAAEADVIVDGILGTGTSADPALRGTGREVVDAILPVVRRAGTPLVVAVDLPSGIHPDTGQASEHALPANLTVTFGACKAGLLIEPGRTLAGRVQLIEIGLDLRGVEPIVRL